MQVITTQQLALVSLFHTVNCNTVNKKVFYSEPLNTKPWSVFKFDLMPVPDIRISDHSKTGQKCLVASLDRLIKKRVMNKIFFMPKRSRLAVKNVRSGFQIVPPFKNQTKLNKKVKTGQKSPVFKWFLTNWPPKPFEYRTQKVSEK
jgi:hypothetical protein